VLGAANGLLRNHVPPILSALTTVLVHLIGRLVTLFRVTVALAFYDAIAEADARPARASALVQP
jgi:hypothetical protein